VGMFGSRMIWLVIVCAVLSGCASIVEGTDQTLNVQVSPETAVCKLTQKGSVIATIDKGGGQVQVPKSRDDIAVDCIAPGYERQAMNIESSASGWGVVGCFLIDLCITDYSTGALNKYPKSISIKLRQQANANPNSPPFPPGGSTGAAPKDGSNAPSITVWHTIGDNVQAYTNTGWVPMPASTSLALVEQRADMGLFRYADQNGSSGQGWIAMTNVRQQP
jgi:hypothetical protein